MENTIKIACRGSVFRYYQKYGRLRVNTFDGTAQGEAVISLHYLKRRYPDKSVEFFTKLRDSIIGHSLEPIALMDERYILGLKECLLHIKQLPYNNKGMYYSGREAVVDLSLIWDSRDELLVLMDEILGFLKGGIIVEFNSNSM